MEFFTARRSKGCLRFTRQSKTATLQLQTQAARGNEDGWMRQILSDFVDPNSIGPPWKHVS